MLDFFPIPRTPERRRLSFVSGCSGCGVLFVNPLPTSNEVEKYYSKQGTWAKRQGERVKEPRKAPPGPRRPDRLLTALEPYAPQLSSSTGRVLDFGCGDGKFLNRMKARGWQTYGIEPSSDAAFHKHTRLTEIPGDGSFDFVVLNHVIEHLLDPLGMLRRLAAALRPGGILFVSTPRLDTLPQHRDIAYCLSGRRHVMSFSETCLRGLLGRAGLDTVARIDAPELDEAFTAGQPLRLRLLARRAAAPLPAPTRPLSAALRALAGYRSATQGWTDRVWGLMPVRFRAARAEVKMTHEFAARKQAVGESVTRQLGG